MQRRIKKLNSFYHTINENKIKKHMYVLIRTLLLVFLIIALARPRKGMKERNIVKPAVDIMLVLDVSISMRALDFKPDNRMQAAVKAAKEFVVARENDRIGVVVFSGLPVLQCPLTLDSQAILRLLDKISSGMVQVDGTAVGLGVALGLKYLEKSDSPSKVLVLLTDGANNTGDIDPETAAQMAKSLGIKVYAIGAGKPGPTQIPVEHPYFGMQLVSIPDELDEDSLTHMAQLTDGKYFRATSLKELKDIYKEIDRMEKKNMEVSEYYEFEEKYIVYLIMGALLMFLEIVFRFVYPGVFI
ncbi:VWA domain-containing protein [Elusimicrobiota bacterium]